MNKLSHYGQTLLSSGNTLYKILVVSESAYNETNKFKFELIFEAEHLKAKNKYYKFTDGKNEIYFMEYVYPYDKKKKAFVIIDEIMIEPLKKYFWTGASQKEKDSGHLSYINMRFHRFILSGDNDMYDIHHIGHTFDNRCSYLMFITENTLSHNKMHAEERKKHIFRPKNIPKLNSKINNPTCSECKFDRMCRTCNAVLTIDTDIEFLKFTNSLFEDWYLELVKNK